MNKMVYEKLRDAISNATDPEKMSKAEALEIYEALATDLEGWCDALQNELENEQ